MLTRELNSLLALLVVFLVEGVVLGRGEVLDDGVFGFDHFGNNFLFCYVLW